MSFKFEDLLSRPNILEENRGYKETIFEEDVKRHNDQE